MPSVEAVVNAIGCGDTVSAGLLLGILSEHSHEDALRLGLAAASAACTTPIPAQFDVGLAQDLLVQVKATEL